MKAYIYIDESGTPSLDLEKNGVLPYMVYSAVIFEENNIDLAKNLLQMIIKGNNIQQGYIKSQNLNYNKRIKILTALKGVEHYVISLVIDKSKIEKESGLQYKQSYIKYFQRILSKQFLQDYDEIHIVLDKMGYPEFQDSLKQYMFEHGIMGRTLFTYNTFRLAEDTKEEPLLQYADVYAGTICKYYCYQYNKEQAQNIHNVISGKVSIEWFPWESITLFAAENLFSNSFDNELYYLSLDTAKRYIESHENDDVEGVELIKYLIQESTRNPCRVISSKEIKYNLQKRGIELGDPISKISYLRSRRVIIISPQGKKGYKFPTSEKELADFYDRLRDNVIPQLKRCRILNNVLQEKSVGKYGVLKHKEYELLNQLCEIVNRETIKKNNENVFK